MNIFLEVTYAYHSFDEGNKGKKKIFGGVVYIIVRWNGEWE